MRDRGILELGNQYSLIVGVNDLATKYPEIASEWDYEKNGELTPQHTYCNSNKKVWWIGACGHSYMANPNNRTHGSGCPYCRGMKVLSGFNDLLSRYPSVASEWNYVKNDILPHNVQCHTKKTYWWKCAYGHEWQQSVIRRTIDGCKCPMCKNGNHVSFPEKAMLFYVVQIFNDAVGNYRSDWLNGFELDIFIPSINTAIEYDGERWHNEASSDKELRKYLLCKEQNIKLIRIRERIVGNERLISDSCISISNANIYKSKKAFSSLIYETLCQLTAFRPWLRKNIDIDIERDCQTIKSSYLYGNAKNNLKELVPDIDKYWDYSKNANSPNLHNAYSRDNAWWICPDCGISFQKTATNWYRRGDIRPYCPECTQKHRYLKASLHKQKPIIGTDKLGEQLRFNSAREASEYLYDNFGVSRDSYKNISACLRGKQNTAYGYHWEYVDNEPWVDNENTK